MDMTEWRAQRAVYERRETAALNDLGFAALFLNRTNRSGIIGGGVIGGKKQAGTWRLDARFNTEELVRRIRRIGRYRGRILLYQRDALAFTEEVVSALGSNTFAFYDPPYIAKGTGLYLNKYGLGDHRALAARVMKLRHPWVVTYDSAAVREDLYSGRRRMVYSLSYAAQSRVREREAMFFSDALELPSGWSPHGENLLSRPGNRHAIYGAVAEGASGRGAAPSPEAPIEGSTRVSEVRGQTTVAPSAGV